MEQKKETLKIIFCQFFCRDNFINEKYLNLHFYPIFEQQYSRGCSMIR